jgi:hypothetical protein
MIFEMKILRRIFGPRLEGNQWRMRTYAELEKMYKYFNSGIFIQPRRLDGWDIYSGRVMQETPRKYI